MDEAADVLSFIKHHRNNFALKSDKDLTSRIDNALDLIYKEGFSNATVLKDETAQKPAKSKRKLQDKWLLPSLVMENMEPEQLWQQLELWNRKALPLSIQMSSWTLTKKNRDSEDSEGEIEEEDEEKIDFQAKDRFEAASSSEGEERDRDDEFEGESEEEETGEKEQKKVRFAENVDEEESESGEADRDEEEGQTEAVKKDNFFDMGDFEKFADEQIANEGDEMLYSDFMAQENDDQPDGKAMYTDLFDAPASKKSKRTEEVDNKQPGSLSTFERKQANEKRMVEKIEEENVGPKPWTLSGEVDAKERPQNSLLEHHVEFDHATRLAPIVTEDFSKSIEEIIKQRVIDKAWDDVERKVKPIGDVAEFRRRAMLDSEKSKMSLAELYEKDYSDKQKDQLPGFGRDMAVDDKVEAIKSDMRDLFFKLDSLSHFQFTPKTPMPELRIVKNMPSATMEEAAPVTVSDAALLAPAEVKRPISGEIKSKEEQSETDRKRARRRAKVHMRTKQKTTMYKLVIKAAAGDTKAEKLLALQKLKTGSRVKIATEEPDKKKKKKGVKSGKSKEPVVSGVKSSSEFFARLQDEVDSQIHERKIKNKKKRAQ